MLSSTVAAWAIGPTIHKSQLPYLRNERANYARAAARTANLSPRWYPIALRWTELADITEARIALREAA